MLNIRLVGLVPMTVYSPLSTGMTTLVNFLSGVLIFHDPLTKKQIAGFFAGLAAVIFASVA